MNSIGESILAIALAIVGLMGLALVLSPKGTAIPLAQTVFSGFGNDLAVAGSPVTGANVPISLAYPSTSGAGAFTGATY